MTDITCCITGHRPQSLPWGFREDDGRCLAVRAELGRTVEGLFRRGFRRFITGMAMGADLIFAETVLETLPPDAVLLAAAIPFPGQPDRWPPREQARYRAILERCGERHTLSPSYIPGCMHLRNRWMVDQSGVVVAVWNGQLRGGTYSTLRYARDLGREVLIVPAESA
ncbi:MAG: DUF1273 domain-containing protein [Oscillospiraceae bacterium]|nr:DUF1273 domain-containing protein [Oscillospiraceae bacterium]